MAFNWTCPHCGTLQTVVREKHKIYNQRIYMEDQSDGRLVARVVAVGCSAAGCLKHSVLVTLGGGKLSNDNWVVDDKAVIFDQMIYPQGAAKPQPDYIPQPLRDDYREACLIRDLSPKAAATLVRRCLQGMIRDFAGISKGRLIDEIKALRAAVDEGKAPEGVSLDSVDAIDAVRGIGNIGAHMEKDINIIVDVDPGEAQLLIDLAEMLFEEWYVQRHKRRERLNQIQALAAGKKAEIAAWKDLANAAKASDGGKE